MKARLLYVFLIFCCAQIFSSGDLWAQTYTTTGNSLDWTNPSAWVKTNPDGCPVQNQNTSTTPPFGPIWSPTCPIRIVINHPIRFNGSGNLGGGQITTMTINNGGNLTITGNLTTANTGAPYPSISINSGAIFNVNGALILRDRATLLVNNSLNLTNRTTVNLGSFEIANEGNSQLVDFGQGTVFNVAGLSRLNAGLATLNINGEFNSAGLEATSISSTLNIKGNSKVTITGDFKAGSSVNISDYSIVKVAGNLETSTDRIFTATGYSFIQVAGNHTVNGNAPMYLTNYAQIQIDGNTINGWTNSGQTVDQNACYKSKNFNKGNACVLCGETYNAEGTFRVPPGVTELTVEVVGGGGAGGSINNAIRGTGGGGGGSYSRRVVAVLPGQLLYIYIGQGATSTNGTSQAGGTSFVSLAEASISSPTAIANSIVFARGGQSTASNVSAGSPGGIALSGSEVTSRPGTVSFSGGNGANNSGGGGSAAANNANGNNGGNPSPGADPIGPGGIGGEGSYGGRGRSPANGMGGGGGGSLTYNPETIIGAHGANGGVIISYTCPKVEPCSRVVNFGSIGDNYIIEYYCAGTWVAPEGLKEFGITAIGGGGGGAAGNIAYGGRGGQINSTSGSGIYFDINKKGNNALGLPAGTIFNISVGEGGKGGTLPSNGLAGNSSSVTGSFVDYSGNTISYNHIALGGNGGSSSFTPTENGLSIPASVPYRRPALAGIYGASGGSTIAPAAGTGGVGTGTNNGPGSPATRNSGSGGGGGTTGGGAGGSGKVFIYYPVFRILPVEFLAFTATYQSDTRSGLLNWATAKEWENEGFDIERSVNNVRDWETIGQVQGAGYSDKRVDYTYQDLKLPLTGGNIFYRLKQRDYDGDSSYSDTKSIRVEKMPDTSYWRVFPNPTSGDPINLELLDSDIYHDEPVIVRIISASGHFDVVESRGGPSLSVLVSDVLKAKASGVYTIEISWNIYREYHKIILDR